MIPLCTLWLLADADPSALAGSSGWVGAGLLGLVVGWLLLKGYPQGLQAMHDIVALHAATEKEQRAVHSALEEKQRAEYQASMQLLLEHCRVELREIAARLPKAPPPT